MELTPLKIPGKRKRRGEDIHYKRKSQFNERRDETRNSRKQRVVSRPDRTTSRIEKLPGELIEHIFFYCLNIGLPRSSPILSLSLSCRSIYIKTTLAVFGPTWHKCSENNSISAPIADYGNYLENSQLQSDILRCRWASLSTLMEAKIIWIKKYPATPLLKYFNPDTKNRLKKTDISLFNYEKYLENDFKGFTEITLLRHNIPDKSEVCWETGHDVAIGVDIPMNLLRGPWSEEDIKYLFWLIKSGAELDWLNSVAGETALDGFKHAIYSGDIRVIYLLLWKGLWESGIECMFHQIIDGRKLLVWALRNVGGDSLAVMNHLFTLARNIISNEEKEEILNELSDLKLEAVQTNDQEKLSWILQFQPVARELIRPYMERLVYT